MVWDVVSILIYMIAALAAYLLSLGIGRLEVYARGNHEWQQVLVEFCRAVDDVERRLRIWTRNTMLLTGGFLSAFNLFGRALVDMSDWVKYLPLVGKLAVLLMLAAGAFGVIGLLKYLVRRALMERP